MIKNLVANLKSREFVPAWITIVIIGVFRFAIGVFLNNLRGPSGPDAIFICFPILAIFVVFFVVVVVVSVRLFRHTRNFVLIAVLISGIVAVFLLPLPPRRPTPEEKLFLAHRSDFEQVVELAKYNKLAVALPDCRAGYFPPVEYQFVSAANCMFIDRYGDNGLSVQFIPFNVYHPILYVERITEKPCAEADGYIEKKLDDHWYVCQGDWN